MLRCLPMNSERINVALISEAFAGESAFERLRDRLKEARGRGADLCLLPELPLNPWSPATKTLRNEDAEKPDGPRCMMQRDAAREAGVALVGGAILIDPTSAKRRNTALVISDQGRVLGAYCKCHIPEEPGFWETSHYARGTQPPSVFNQLGVPFGIQICSDSMRPEGSHALGALGADMILAPRATEQATYERWKIVYQANAMTSCLYVLSVNRPTPEQGVLIGGPSIAVDPDGKVLLETTDPIGIVTIERSVVKEARSKYPGYLPVRADLYARSWSDAARRSSAGQ